MPRMKPPQGYYTLTEAAKILNLSNAMVRRYVEKGKIHYHQPEGREHGFYLKKDVDNLANELDAFMMMQSKTSSTFERATEDDLKATVEITRVLFGLRDTPEATLARRLSWLRQNPEVFYILKSEGTVVGYFVWLPLKPEKIMNILNGTEYSQETNAEEIETFEPGKPLHIYLMGIGVRPGLSHFEKRSYGARLIAGVMKTIIDFGRRGIVIDTFYARSDTPDGIRILTQGFTETSSETHARNFIIKVKESGIPFIQEYKRALRENGQHL
jgi:excisionase family DNA binding protein